MGVRGMDTSTEEEPGGSSSTGGNAGPQRNGPLTEEVVSSTSVGLVGISTSTSYVNE